MTAACVLVQYSSLFNCYSKFERKVSRILSSMDGFSVVYFEDARGFIHRMLDADSRVCRSTKVDSLEVVTHAILIDDGVEFTELASKCEESGIVVRRVKVPISRVLNIKKETEYQSVKSTPEYEYIGRGSDWGNPYAMFDGSPDEGVSTREEVIAKFKYDFERGFLKRNKEDALILMGKKLGCFCKPQSCHGDVIADFLNSYDDGR
jgi:hypothetical protein